jgi:hypothetical protein
MDGKQESTQLDAIPIILYTKNNDIKERNKISY